ncbi:hypothetical protein C1H46_007002 [Malus baccata]|uniref:Exostosin GT47 domain-containing protein n=1 Tax=Malus baccata TaxID=106549 RepID=A0A540N8L7_MALBA|nr:hypothetical protein C1H46_007002 [Malus baccata]
MKRLLVLMEKSRLAGRCHNQPWFVLLIASFLLVFVLLLSDYSALSAGRNTQQVTYFITNFANVIVNQDNSTSLPYHDHSTPIPSNQTEICLTLNVTNSSTSNAIPAQFFGHGREENHSVESLVISNPPTVQLISPPPVQPISPPPVQSISSPPVQSISPPPVQPISNEIGKNNSDADSCSGRYIYVYDLPKRFNQDLLKNCHSLVRWNDMCSHLSNMGLGPIIRNSKGKLVANGWFATNQFSLEVIFHNRMKQYRCLTNDSSLASAIFVPFYAGLDVGRYLWDYNTSVRDASPLELVKWLSRRPEWKAMWGRDHFLVGGRIAWDFRRLTDNNSDWGSKLMFLPESKNMTLLSIESGSWNNEQAIPYPTYFHPSKDSEVFEWQRRMRNRKRRYLFSFAGAPRSDSKDNIRDTIINQCRSSATCKLVSCYNGAKKCDDPLNVMKVFEASVFCLQPSGDSYTRRSTFDSILAGCIPVFFHPGSAYVQYLWHFPNTPSKYSVFISENDIKDQKAIINETLLRIPKHQVVAMRKEVIRLIPRVIYANPMAPRLETVEDAFDIAVKGMLDKVEKIRRDMKEGKDPGVAFSELNGRKFDMPAG